MAYEAIWYHTRIPDKVIDLLTEDLEQATEDTQFSESMTKSGSDFKMRDSSNLWVPETHWVCGMLWHYIQLANRNNFRYDIDGFDNGSIQYTRYQEGNYYNWHKDDGVSNAYTPVDDPEEDFIKGSTQKIRKLSVTVQLSSHEDYTGGEVQFLENNNKTFFAPKKKGTVIVFDSRLPHRAKKVLTGERRSLVGWVVGPQWR